MIRFINFAPMTQFQKKNTMLKMPVYPGGNKAFKEFITKNLHYPDEAQAANIEGGVIVEYEISDDGVVKNPHVLKGIGYGCDEEAIRVISLLKYEKVRNRRVRVKVTHKTTIHFHLNRPSLSYSIAETQKSPEPAAGQEKPAGDTSYTYTIEY